MYFKFVVLPGWPLAWKKSPLTAYLIWKKLSSTTCNILIELGRGFCFEARQKRITFDNKPYRIDLVFHHRVLKNAIVSLTQKLVSLTIQISISQDRRMNRLPA